LSDRLTTTKRAVPILLMAIVGMIIITSQSPAAFAGACTDIDKDGYYPTNAPIYCGNVDERDCDDTDPEVGTGPGCVYQEAIVIDSDVNEDFELSPGDIVVISYGATINGNIKVEGGTLTLEYGATVKGNVDSDKGGTIIISDSTVEGNVKSVEGDLTINGASVINGNVESDKGASVFVVGSTIDGNIVIKEAMSVTVTGNTVAGNVEIEETSGSCEDTGNTVNGNFDGCP